MVFEWGSLLFEWVCKQAELLLLELWKFKCGRFAKLTFTALTVWAALCAEDIIRPILFHFNVEFLGNVKKYFYTDSMWAEQNHLFLHNIKAGTSSLFSMSTLAIKSLHLISKSTLKGGMDWLPYSSDLNFCDFFL